MNKTMASILVTEEAHRAIAVKGRDVKNKISRPTEAIVNRQNSLPDSFRKPAIRHYISGCQAGWN